MSIILYSASFSLLIAFLTSINTFILTSHASNLLLYRLEWVYQPYIEKSDLVHHRQYFPKQNAKTPLIPCPLPSIDAFCSMLSAQ